MGVPGDWWPLLGLGSLRIGDSLGLGSLRTGSPRSWGSLGVGVSPSGRKRTGRCRRWWRRRRPAAAEPSPSACRPGGPSKVTPKPTPWAPSSPPGAPHPPQGALAHPGHKAEGSNPTVLGMGSTSSPPCHQGATNPSLGVWRAGLGVPPGPPPRERPFLTFRASMEFLRAQSRAVCSSSRADELLAAGNGKGGMGHGGHGHSSADGTPLGHYQGVWSPQVGFWGFGILRFGTRWVWGGLISSGC